MQDVPKIVRARLQRPTPATTEVHPDADLLTAFAEHTLAGNERDHVLEHIAHCADCREVVVLALPATEAVALTRSASARTGWFSLPVLRWGVVAAGVVLLASVGILEYRQRQQEKTLVATSLRSREQPAESIPHSPAPPPSATGSEPVTPPAESKKRTEMGKQTEISKKAPAPVLPPAGNSLTVSKPVDKQVHAPNAIFPRPEPMRRSTSVGAAHSATGGYGFASRAGRSSIGGPITPRSDAEPAAADQLQGLSKAKPALDQAAPALAPAPLLHAQPTLMKSPVDVRWTISASGGLQRSIDGGNTWIDVDVAANNSTTATLVRPVQSGTTVEVSGAAPQLQTESNSETELEAKAETKSETKSQTKFAAKSATKPSAAAGVKSAEAGPALPRTIFRAVSVTSNAGEVWAGGSGGALYHTWDGGNRWARVIPSDAASTLTGDIIAIQFPNPRNGIVTTSTTEVWTTLDAGQTWHKQK
jgi:photosystem II stability/assembly factor-like uncharacterized protein